MTSAAALRLLTLYNVNIYDASTNPGGLDGKGGMETNYLAVAADVATIGEETAASADAAAASAVEAASHVATVVAAENTAVAAATTTTQQATIAQTASSQAQAAVASVTTGSTTALSFPAVDKVLLTAADVVAVFVYDTRKDDDGGAWRWGCARNTWWGEALNTATRGARREFPMVALIVVQATKLTIYDALDLDPATGTPRMWMVFNRVSGGTIHLTVPITGVHALNGVIRLTQTDGASDGNLVEISFPGDRWVRRWDSATGSTGRGIANRNSNVATPTAVGALVSYKCYAVHTRVLAGAPLDPVSSLPVPTVAVATGGGASVIHPSGAVYDLTGAACSMVQIDAAGILRIVSVGVIYNEPLPYADRALSLTTAYRPNAGTGVANIRIPAGGNNPVIAVVPGGIAGGSSGNAPFVPGYMGAFWVSEDAGNPANGMIAVANTGWATGWMPGDIRGAYLCDGTTGVITGSGELVTNGDFATNTTGWVLNGTGSLTHSAGAMQVTNSSGTASGAGVYQDIPVTVGQTYLIFADKANGTATAIFGVYGAASFSGGSLLASDASSSSTKTILQVTATTTTLRVYCTTNGTGTALFDNVSVKLATPDRSYKGKGLVIHGTLTRSAVATGADLVAWSGFSASNYLEQPSNNSDMDFGTADFYVGAWVKETGSGGRTLFERAYYTGSSYSGAAIKIGLQASSYAFVAITTDGYSTSDLAVGSVALNDGNPHFLVAVRRGTKLEVWVDGVLAGSTTITNATGSLNNGSAVARWGVRVDGQGALQSAAMARVSAYAPTPAQIRKMYADEAPLFRAGAWAFLKGTSNNVQSLCRDELRDLTHVTTDDGVTAIAGIQPVSYHDASTLTALTSDNVKAVSASGGIVLYGSAAEAGVTCEAIVGKEAVLEPKARAAATAPRMTATTTDATPTVLSPRWPVSEGARQKLRIKVIGAQNGASGAEFLDATLELMVYRPEGGTLAMSGNVLTTYIRRTTSTMAVSASIDTTNNAVIVTVTGKAATPMTWASEVEATTL